MQPLLVRLSVGGAAQLYRQGWVRPAPPLHVGDGQAQLRDAPAPAGEVPGRGMNVDCAMHAWTDA